MTGWMQRVGKTPPWEETNTTVEPHIICLFIEMTPKTPEMKDGYRMSFLEL